MKKRLIIFPAVTMGILLYTTLSFAYIDNMTSMSAEWARTGNRNAATDAADIVAYNPAGVSELPQGFHLNVYSLYQSQNRDFTTKEGAKSVRYGEDDVNNLFPGCSGVFNINKWSVFGGIDIPNGETVRRYKGGSLVTHLAGRTILASPIHNADYNILTDALTSGLSQPPHSFIRIGDDGSGDKYVYKDLANSYYEEKGQFHISTLGVAYRFGDAFSLALGIRHANADLSTKAGVSVSGLSDDALVMNSFSPGFFPESVSFESSRDMIAWGTGGIIGININAGDSLNIAAQIQTPVKIVERVEIHKDELHIFSVDEKQRKDLPGMAALGFGYDFSKKIYGEFNVNYWPQGSVDWERYGAYNRAELAGDVWRSGTTLSYRLTKMLLVSGGTSYTHYDRDALSTYTDAGPGLSENLFTDNLFVGTGFSFAFVRNIKFNFGISHTFYKKRAFSMESRNSSFDVSSENDSTIIAFGVDMSL